MFSFFNNRKKHRGFSLIEIMVVVVIMGTLAGGAAIVASKNSEKAKFSQAEKDLDTFLSAMGTAYSESGSFGTVTTGNSIAGAFTGTFKTKLEAQVNRALSELTDPWGNAYYVYSTYNDSTKGGVIKIYCQAATGGTSSADPATSTNARVNTNNNNRKMYRQVYNGG